MFDHYATLSHKSMSGIDTDFVKMKGLSFGLNVYYNIPLSRTFSIKPGIGFYRYSFNDITLTKKNKQGINHERYIHYPNTLFMDPYTDKYFYNCFCLIFAIERKFRLGEKSEANIGVNINNYITFNQRYQLERADKEDHYKHTGWYYGTSAGLYVNFVKNINRYSIGPSLIIPIYSSWGKDEMFPEEKNGDYRNKWFNGIGLGCTIGYQLNRQAGHKAK